MRQDLWSTQELEILKQYYPNTSWVQLEKILPGRARKAVNQKARTLGLEKQGRIYITSVQLEEIKRDYATTLNQDLANRYGCSICTIQSTGSRNNLKKDPEFMKGIFREKLLNPNHPARLYTFPKGNTPQNKGKKQSEYLSPEAIKNIAQTTFKKGNLPYNTLHDSAITQRSSKDGHTYKWIRITMAKWVPLHRYVYEQHYGKISKGTNIQFKDGNTLNCDIKNLYAIDRNDQMLENSGAINLPDSMIASYLAGKNSPELKDEYLKHPQLLDLKRKQIIINRKIKENGRTTEKD